MQVSQTEGDAMNKRSDTCVHDWSYLSHNSARNGLRWCRVCGLLRVVRPFGNDTLPAVGVSATETK